MFYLNIGFCSVALVLLTLVAVEAESAVARGHMLADAEIALKQPVTPTVHARPLGALRGTP
jgi:hypothetical protein